MKKNKLTTIVVNAIIPTFGMMIMVHNMFNAPDNELIRLLTKFTFSFAISMVITSLVIATNTLKDELEKVRDELRNLKQEQPENNTRD